MNKEFAKSQFGKLIRRYKEYRLTAKKEDISEETIRTWINELLLIFGWDVKNTNEVIQEKILSKKQRLKLKSIKSKHSIPDYKLLNGNIIKTFVDAKDLSISISTDKSVSFQIRSYGWSSDISCAFVTNFEELGIYDCTFMPNPEQEANYGMQYFCIDNYMNNFDVIFDHLYKNNIINGNLDVIYSKPLTEGRNRLDESFTEILSKFRVTLAKNILVSNQKFISNNNLRLNYYVQVIMDRIVFIRVCESRNIEEEGLLRFFLREGFWENFKNSCYMDFYTHYDGAMFERDNNFNELVFDNNVFEDFINSLYYPSPFKFDVIPVKVIANIYENFLSKQLEIYSGDVIETLKSEYIKTNGIISTPKYIVEVICKTTMKLNEFTSIQELLSLRILDPCCGSGIFLVTCFELIEDRMITFYKEGKVEKEYLNWFVHGDSSVYLTVDAKREIMKHCIYGIDCDETAIEVSKMSLALKIIDNNDQLALQDLGVFGEKILCDVHINIKLGNTLIWSNLSFDIEDFKSIKPFDIKNFGFKHVYDEYGGFTHIIGNPPYVETKHYKKSSPLMHNYLSKNYKTFAGKADLAILFIERCLDLLNSTGKIGFIVQKRFFKTDYGIKIRKLISENKYLNKIIDFKTEKIFYKRMTYVAIMILDKKGRDILDYEYIDKEPMEIQYLFENESAYKSNIDILKIKIPSKYITENTWSFESYYLLSLLANLRKKFGTLGQYPNLHIKDGVQALWKKAYHFTDFSIKYGILSGKNGWNETVEIEMDMVKAIIYNKSFYCYKELTPDAYCIFPYEGDNLRTPIPMSKIKSRYPLAYKYLTDKELIIKEAVNHYDDEEFWHRYTREHNHDTYYENKIIVPMTARDTIATYVESQGLYMDNANVWFIIIDNADNKNMIAITSIINSTVFSVFATSEANPQSGGYYKLNKQFLMPVPFPSKNLIKDQEAVDELVKLQALIKAAQIEYLNADANQKHLVKGLLEGYWNKLDKIVYSLYELTDTEIELLKNIGRSTDRVDLLE